MKICQICGKEIDFSSRAKKYCSEECRKRVKYEKDRAWLKAHPEKAVEYARKWREENLEISRQKSRDAYRKKCLAKIEEETA
jgi:hypothetical protein